MQQLSRFERLFIKIVRYYIKYYQKNAFKFYFDNLEYPKIGKGKLIKVKFINSKEVFRRIFKQGSLGLGETYCEGLIDVNDNDYKDFLFIFVRLVKDKRILKSLSVLDKLAILKTMIYGKISTKNNQYKNINSHYSLSNWFNDEKDSNKFYLYWLDPKYVQYTCAKWDKNAKTLEQAQVNKFEFYRKRLGIDKKSKAKTLLDLGCGWGEFMFYLNKRYGLICKGITLSKAQARYINEQIKKRKIKGVSVDNINVHEMYGKYDYVTAIGLLEHIDDYNDLYKKTHKALKERGRALFHAMFHKGFYKPDTFLLKYVFPEGSTPDIDKNLKIFKKYFSYVNKHTFDKIFYPKTLDCWYNNFLKNERKIRKLFKDKGKVKNIDYAIRIFKHYLVSASAQLSMEKNIRNILLKK